MNTCQQITEYHSNPMWTIDDMVFDLVDGGSFLSNEEAIAEIKSAFEGTGIDIMNAKMDANSFVDLVIEHMYAR